ncbi:MAG: class II aldolase/adducin family protein [Acidimicrobiales bacterium]
MPLVLDRYPDITYHANQAGSMAADDLDEVRRLRQWEVAIGYRIFAALRWGQLGDGHITARDPERPDHFWVLGYGIPFGQATVANLSLIAPDGRVVEGAAAGGVNTAAYNIHWPVLDARPDVVSAAHAHTQFGTPWSANVAPFQPITQESCTFVFDQSLYAGTDLEVISTDGGRAIAAALGPNRLCILRNHGLLTAADSPAQAVGLFVTAERVAEAHVKAPHAQPIPDEDAKAVSANLGVESIGWRAFQWLARELVPDPSVVL